MTTEAEAGKLIRIEDGEYSDYEVIGFFLVLKTFEPQAELRKFILANPEMRETYRFNKDKFLAFLLEKGLLLEIEHGILFMGSDSATGVNFCPCTPEDQDDE